MGLDDNVNNIQFAISLDIWNKTFMFYLVENNSSVFLIYCMYCIVCKLMIFTNKKNFKILKIYTINLLPFFNVLNSNKYHIIENIVMSQIFENSVTEVFWFSFCLSSSR